MELIRTECINILAHISIHNIASWKFFPLEGHDGLGSISLQDNGLKPVSTFMIDKFDFLLVYRANLAHFPYSKMVAIVKD